jgi:hypothetical protein
VSWYSVADGAAHKQSGAARVRQQAEIESVRVGGVRRGLGRDSADRRLQF